MQHQDPMDKDCRELHGSHHLHQVVQQHSIIGLEHVQADKESSNFVGLNVVNRAKNISNTMPATGQKVCGGGGGVVVWWWCGGGGLGLL